MASTDQNNSTSVLGQLGITGPPPSAAKQPTYLGIPDKYKPPTVPVPSSYRRPPGSPALPNVFGTPVNTDPYTEADKWGPAADLSSVPQIQAELIAAGLLRQTDVRVGVWDAKSADAYGNVLSFANQQGLSAMDALTVLTSNPPIGSQTAGPKGPGPRTIAFTNPEDVQTGYQNVSQQLTGQEQDPSQFVQDYHQQEAAQAGTNGTNYTQAPSLTGAATQYVQQHMPNQELSYGVASRMNEFLSLVKGG